MMNLQEFAQKIVTPIALREAERVWNSGLHRGSKTPWETLSSKEQLMFLDWLCENSDADE